VLEFRILGSLEVLDEGRPVALSGQKQRALLALLLLRANDVVPAERLIELLWGENAPRTAATSLQNFVSQLRKAIGPEVLETRAPGYRLNVEPRQLDLSRFEQLVRRARESEPTERARLLGEALALWRGTPLADFAYEPWAQNEIRRLEDLRLGALEERIAAELELDRHAELTSELEALVAEHPQRERLRGQLMLALYRSGRQAEALQAYQDARRTLVDELGIEPGPELQRLNASILRQESTLERVGSAQPDDSIGDVVRALMAGRVVPVLGPRAEPAGAPDLVEHLVKAFDYADRTGDLTRVSQYIATISGEGPLYDALHDLYGVELVPGRVHRFLATLPPILRARGAPHQLIVTTAYDLALEQAFGEAGEEFDVVVYLATGRSRGKFLHVAPGQPPTVINEPNLYATELSLDRRTVILRVHGRVDSADGREWESFVVTEDDYIGYLTPGELASMIPVGLAARLRRSHFLFLGYALRDWHLRLLLNRLWGDEKVGYRSWSVQPDASALETEFWRRRDVDLFELGLDEYVNALEQRLTEVAV
ncbi:MAG: BTAD domain-containing putative transcriptional regulator, partial [Actinomycetota bacterium]